jgi:alpha-galactosidase
VVSYNSEERIIKLTNKNIAYIVYINEDGCLETVYFGKALKTESNGVFRSQFVRGIETYNLHKNQAELKTDALHVEASCLEVCSHGFFDKRFSPILIKAQDGCFETDFRYQKHEIYQGVQPLQGQPYAHGAQCETVEFLLKDTRLDIYLILKITIFLDKDIVVKNFEIVNQTEGEIRILRANSMQLDLRGMDYELVHFPGRYTVERQYEEIALHRGVQEIASNFGTSSHYENPFVYLKSKQANEEYGEVIGLNLIYSGNFKLSIECNYFENTHICYGINDEDFDWALQAGERFTTPQAVISYSYQGIDKMSQNFHRFIRENLITYKKNREYKPILFNSWEGCHFSFDTESILSYIEDACEIGTELFVLDDGWFGRRNDDKAGLGDWWVNRNKIDLHKIIARCREKSIKLGIWFEPEMINYDSDLYRNHPEYALGSVGQKTTYLWRNQLCLDYSSAEVVDAIYQQMRAFLQEYPVDYIKWDYNRIVGEHFSQHCKNQGEVYHRLVLGYYALIEKIRAEYPDVMIEGCAGGGARFDMATLFYAPQIWASDESNPARRAYINYNTSLGYPLSCIGTHVNNSTITDYKSKAIFALFGTYGYEMNPNTLTEEEKAEIREVAEIYRADHLDVIQEGTLYHLRSPNTSNYMAIECVNKSQTKAFVLWLTKEHEYQKHRRLKCRGLKKETLYRSSIDGKVYDGEYLMEVGLDISHEYYCEFDFRLHILTAVQ